MAIVEKKYTIEGTLPTLMHNSQTADPMNPYAKETKKYTGKKKKTEDDYREIYRLHFFER